MQVLKTLNEYYDYAALRLSLKPGKDSARLGGDAVEEQDGPSTTGTAPSIGAEGVNSASTTSSGAYWARICANEAEFRAYYCLCHLYNPSEVSDRLVPTP